MQILELLSKKQGLTGSQVARVFNTNRSESYRFLSTFTEMGYVIKDDDGRYHLSYRVLELGMRVINSHEILRLVRPYMYELSLAFNETVNLGYFDGDAILHLDKIDSKEILRMDTPIGSRAPAFCSALGKAILAYLPTVDLNEYLNKTVIHANGPHSITSKKAFIKEIEKVRQRGYSIDDEEFAPGIRCISCPVFDPSAGRPYAISVSGPTIRMTYKKIQHIKPVILKVCQELSIKLDHTAAAYNEK